MRFQDKHDTLKKKMHGGLGDIIDSETPTVSNKLQKQTRISKLLANIENVIKSNKSKELNKSEEQDKSEELDKSEEQIHEIVQKINEYYNTHKTSDNTLTSNLLINIDNKIQELSETEQLLKKKEDLKKIWVLINKILKHKLLDNTLTSNLSTNIDNKTQELSKTHEQSEAHELLKKEEELKKIWVLINKILKHKNSFSNSSKPNENDFFEGQTDMLSCGRHALNNLLGSQIFVITTTKEGQVNLLELCNSLKKLEEAIYNYALTNHTLVLVEDGITYFDKCQPNENYEIKLLLYALLHIGKNAKIIDNLDSIFNNNSNNSNNLKMVLNIGGAHWVSISSSSDLISNGQHNYYDSIQKQIITFDNRTKLYEHIKSKNVIKNQAILLNDSITDSDNLVKKTLVKDILSARIANRPMNNPLSDSKLNNPLSDSGFYKTISESLLKFDDQVYKPFSSTSQSSTSQSSIPDPTEFMIKHTGAIYAIGDIHGDIIPLIICLRDCCKVIKKKEGYHFDQETQDKDLNDQMNRDWDDNKYPNDLNYEWCGGNAYVVFCGDLLDNVRRAAEKKPGEFPFEEARIFKFINAINKQANKRQGRLFKVLGNHDMKNLIGEPYSNNISDYALNYNGYKHGAKGRIDYFKKGNPGAKLIGEDGAYLFLMINDFIFVHGGINTNLLRLDNIKKVNKSLMSYIYDKDNAVNFDYNGTSTEAKLTFNGNVGDGLTLDRSFGQPGNFNTDEDMCDKLYKRFSEFVKSFPNEYTFKYDANKLKLVIGHCTQTNNNYGNSTFKTMFTNKNDKNSNAYITEYSGEVSKSSLTPGIYGITVSCGDRNESGEYDKNKPSIYRVDIAMSRGFNNRKIWGEKYDESRTPQALKLLYDNNNNHVVSVLKSTMYNTRIHLNDMLTSYSQKYQKYKLKYMKLKDKINK